MNYSTFDAFLAVDTWHTRHAEDEKRFFTALHQVVSDPRFNADQMAEYMEAKVNDPAFEEAIDHYRAAAWAVGDYLKAIR